MVVISYLVNDTSYEIPSVKMSSARWYFIDLNFSKPTEACNIVVVTVTNYGMDHQGIGLGW
jgi:hypothetical protein